MLEELRVRNAGVIADAAIEPSAGFVVVTGETGAGKTLLLGALRLLLGEPARRDHVGPAGGELEVEGRFRVDGAEHVARRRVTAEGRSRAYLDGDMVPARSLAEIVGPVVELVAQHDALRLSRSEGIRVLIDGALDAEGLGLHEDYRAAHGDYRALCDRQQLIGGDRRALERELDVVRFQADEIAEAGFAVGDDVELRRTAERLRNAEAIAEHLAIIQEAVAGDRGADAAFGTALVAASRLAALDGAFAPLEAQLREASLLVDELGGDVARATADFERDPARLDDVERRLARLGELQRKYGETLEDVLRFAEAATVRAEELTALIEDSASIDAALEKAAARLEDTAARLSAARNAAAIRLANAAIDHLRDLGFADPYLTIIVERTAPGPLGADRFEIRFASDTSLQPGPIKRIASGGELSRLVLALRLAAGVADAPVVAFDEIDAGIGGATALAMGRKLRDLSVGRQVLVVTHLPQVAAFARRHFVVRRQGPTATVVQLGEDDRLEELSRMLAGLSQSEKGREHAAELLEMASV